MKSNPPILDANEELKSLSLLNASVAHDFNNLLTVMQANLEFLLDDPKIHSHRENKKALLDALNACVTGAGLSRNLLAFSSKQSLSFKPLHLKEVVMDVVGFCRHSFGNKHEFIIDETLIKDDPIIEACYTSFSHALLNIFKNAKEAMPKGGKIFIQTHLDPHHVHLYLMDEGEGIPEEVLAQIGEPYFSTKSKSGKGTGLGLAMVKSLMQKHKGQMNISSKHNEGTSVILTFPLCGFQEDSAPESKEVLSDDNFVIKKKVRKTQKLSFSEIKPTERQTEPSNYAYVIDDNPNVCRSTARIVKKIEKIPVIQCTSPLKALTDLAEDELPAWIFVDYEMPEIDGVEFIKKFDTLLKSKGITRDLVKVVLLSGHPTDYFQCFDLAPETFELFLLSKPYTMTAIEELLKTPDHRNHLVHLAHEGQGNNSKKSKCYLASFEAE